MAPGVLPTDALAQFGKQLSDVVLKNLKLVTEALKAFGAAVAADKWLLPLFDRLKKAFGDFSQQAGAWLRPLADKVADTFRAMGAASPQWLQGLAGSVRDVAAHLGQTLPAALGKTLNAFKGLGAVAGVAAGASAGLGLALGALVSKANPAVYQQFTLALNDLLAVVGAAAVPLLKLLTEVVRAFADTLTTFLGDVGGALATVLRPFVDVLKVVFEVVGQVRQSLAKVVEAVAPALATLGNALAEILKAIRPLVTLLIDVVGGALAAVFGALADVVEAAVPYLTAFVRVVGDLIDFLARGVREVLALIGIDLPESGPGARAGSSVGAAVRSAQISDVSSVIQQAQISSYSLGAASGMDPSAKTAAAAESIKKRVDEIYEQILGAPKKIANELAAVLGRGADAAAGFVDRHVGGPIRSIGNFIGEDVLGIDMDSSEAAPLTPEERANSGIFQTMDAMKASRDRAREDARRVLDRIEAAKAMHGPTGGAGGTVE